MSIYKPSLPRPDIAEIDVNKDNEFSVQVNTSGTTVKQYKVQIWTGDGSDLIFESGAIQLNKPIQNKSTLSFDLNKLTDGYGRHPSYYLENGKDYQWSIRTYEQTSRSANSHTNLPKTFVCSGNLVGTTKNVIWVQNGATGTQNGIATSKKISNDNSLLEEGQYVQISCTYKRTSSSISYGKYAPNKFLPPTPPNAEEIELPFNYNDTTGKEQEYIERHKIEYLTTELGQSKNIAKIETDEPFKYNYAPGTSFQIYNCDNKHTLTSVYVEPCDAIERARYIKLSSQTTYNDTVAKLKWRKIIGYNEETGEVRVQEEFDSVPTDGLNYWIGKTEGDGIVLAGNDKKDANSTQTTVSKSPLGIVGGKPLYDFVIMQNKWGSGTDKILFVQPNINILPDGNNPDTIMMPVESDFFADVSVNLQQSLRWEYDQYKTGDKDYFNFSEKIYYIFDKLDNTQWLLWGGTLTPHNPNNYTVNGKSTVPLTWPQTPYKVYTDFQDLSPNGYFYARSTPTINVGYCALDLLRYEDTTGNYSYKYYTPSQWELRYQQGWYDSETGRWTAAIECRDIAFKATWYQPEGVQTKYYQYILYDEDGAVITQSEEKYDTEYTWQFRGFMSPEFTSQSLGTDYFIEVKIVDQYSKEFILVLPFRVKYETIAGEFNTVDIKFDCNEMAYQIQTTAPAYVETTNYTSSGTTLQTVTPANIKNMNITQAANSDKTAVLSIPLGRVLNYSNLKDIQKSPFTIPDQHTFYTQFQITPEFCSNIGFGGESTVFEYSYFNEAAQADEIIKLTFGGITSYYFSGTETGDSGGGEIIENNKRFKLYLYRNDIPLEMFRDPYGNACNYIDLTTMRSDFVSLNELKFVEQSSAGFRLCDNSFPGEGLNTTTIYLLKAYTTYKGKPYLPGPYLYKDGEFYPDTRYEYVWIGNVKQAPLRYRLDANGNVITVASTLRNQVKEKMGIPEANFITPNNTLYPDRTTIGWSDGSYWVDNENVTQANLDILDHFWFEFYFTHTTSNNRRTCQIVMNDRIILPVRQ